MICAPTNSAVDLLLSKLIETGLFNKRIMKRLVGYTYYNSLSYNMDNDEYCFFPELESSQIIRPETSNNKLLIKYFIKYKNDYCTNITINMHILQIQN